MARLKKSPMASTLMGSLFDEPGPKIDEPHPSIERAARLMKEAREADPVFAPVETAAARRHLRFISFGSGSSGNCAYIGDSRSGFLIDAGVDPRLVEETLLHHGIDSGSIRGICLTHDHSDHIRYVYTLLRKWRNIAVYCTPKTLNGILRRHSISRRIKDYHYPIYKEFPFRIDNFEVTAFEVSHDGADNAGFYIDAGDGLSMTVATDLGCITDRVDHYMRLSRHVMIESNYDSDMLARGRYPEYLKARIRAGNGHLDNEVTARFLAGMVAGGLSTVFLCHLSLDNNTPDIALARVREALAGAGVDRVGDGSGTSEALAAPVQLVALPRYVASPVYYLF